MLGGWVTGTGSLRAVEGHFPPLLFLFFHLIHLVHVLSHTLNSFNMFQSVIITEEDAFGNKDLLNEVTV